MKYPSTRFDGVFEFDEDKNRPYTHFECDHHSTYFNRGVLTCRDCGATYNENTLEWEQ